MQINVIDIREDKMFNRIILWGLLLSTAFAVTGCQEPQQKPPAVPAADPLAYGGPDVNSIVVTDSFTSQVIAATGGCEAWVKTKKLQFDCVVTFYNKDGTYYLTEQYHDIYPWSNAIRVSSVEPQGKFVGLLVNDSFSAESPAQIRVQYDIRNMMYAVRYITTAPVRFLDKSVRFVKDAPVRMEGLWYYPFRCSMLSSQTTGDEPRQVAFYQNRDTTFIDIIRFVNPAGMKSLMVRGYDYRIVKEAGLLLPTRIEVFRTNLIGVTQHRLLKIEYHD